MRTIIQTAGMVAAGLIFALGAASASDRDEQAPESRAYFGFAFGGTKAAPRDFHYGLRVDQDRRYVEGPIAPIMQFDFTARGVNDLRVNGLSVLKARYKMRQAEEEAPAEEGAADESVTYETVTDEPAAEETVAEEEVTEEEVSEEVAEDQGFFEGMWSGVTGFFGGLFGGDEGEEEVTETAEAAEETAEEAPEDIAEGTFMGYNAVDWGLLAVGAVGVGFIASEVSNGDEDPDLGADGGSSGTTTGGTTGGTLGGLLGGLTGGLTERTPGIGDERNPEHQKWLDGGTGQMGDLGG